MEYKDIFTSERDLRFYPSRCEQPIRLQPEQIDFFNRQGYLHPLPVLEVDELALHRQLFEDMLERDAGGDGYAVNGYFKKYGGAYDLVMHPVLVDYAQDLVGENLVCWGAHYICKLPGNEKVITWHQDGPLWPFTPTKCVTLWLALDDSLVENGCMKVLPGSHWGGGLTHVDSKVDARDLNGNKIPDHLISGTSVDIELKAGQASAHSDLLVHGSLPNTSQRRRCGVAISYLPTDVRDIGLGWNEGVILCRGTDASGHWKAIPRPQPFAPSGDFQL